MNGIKLASRLDAVTESATLALNARAKQLAAEGKTIYNLTAGELDTATPGYIEQYVATRLDKNKYTPVAGLPELRQAITAHARKFYGLEWIEEESVVVTGGAKPAIYASLLSLIDPDDEVIVPVPAWVSYNHLIELAGGKVVEVPLTQDYDLDVQAILSKITDKTKAVIVNSPHNPTGAVFSAKSLESLARELNRTNITVINDDIYSRLVFGDAFLAPTAGFNNQIIINGFSKSQALTGWRIGYAIAQKPLSGAITALLSHINGNAPLPAQYAGIAAMDRSDEPPKEVIHSLSRRRSLVLEGLDKAGVKHNVPAGAFYIFLDVREFENSSVWCERLLNEAGVALVPGEAFSAPGYARLTYVSDEDTLKKAMVQLQKFVGNNK